MTEHDREETNPKTSLEHRIAATLDDGCARLDPKVGLRLDRIRSEALDAASRCAAGLPRRRWPWKPVTAGLVAASITLTLAVVFVDQSPKAEVPPMTADLDVLTDPRFELFVEDPEFVAWIVEAEPEPSSTENSG